MYRSYNASLHLAGCKAGRLLGSPPVSNESRTVGICDPPWRSNNRRCIFDDFTVVFGGALVVGSILLESVS